MVVTKYLFVSLIFILFKIGPVHCQITGEYDQLVSNELDYLHLKHLPAVLHNENVYLAVVYKCASGSKRHISLSIRIERTLYRTNFAVFRRHWHCHGSAQIRLRYIRVRLHRSLAYASDSQSNLQSWPIERGRLSLVMYRSAQANEQEVLKTLEYDVKFLPVSARPSIRSLPWYPLRSSKPLVNSSPVEPEVVRVVNYPLVMTGGFYGKHFVLPSYRNYQLRLEQQLQLARPKFSIVFWIYVDEYCDPTSSAAHCAILQHLTFDNIHLTAELFFNREGQILVNMFGHLYDRIGTGAKTFASLPKKDWCRMAFVVNEFIWSVFINCLKAWNVPIIATHNAPIFFYSYDELGTFIIGGSDLNSAFRGFIRQMDFYRRIAFTYEQLPKKPDQSILSTLPSIIHRSDECRDSPDLFQQSFEQYQRFNQYLRDKSTCPAQPFLRKKPTTQCLLIRTWKEQLRSKSTSDVRYRVFRALHRKLMNSTMDVATKLFDLSLKLLTLDDPHTSCHRVLTWSKQAVCYAHPAAHSLLATFHQFGLCGLQTNTSRALELLIAGALLNDRLSLLALGHRHYYGLDGVPLDYDAAYVYYRQMAEISRFEFYNPKKGEAAMDFVRLTDEKLLEELTFDKSDSFYWLKQQALRGVASAQHHLGALMYAGSNGLSRNVQAAVEYFRLGAEQHDASSHFGYGLALLKGQGVKQNMTEAIRHLEKAVEHGFYGAQVALGYHAYEIEKNYTKAAQYWKDCFDRIHDMNCAHNLAVMWTAGHYPPDFTPDHVKAWQYYSFAAQRGQIDSKIVVSFYNVRSGHPVIGRNPWLAAIWARHAAEESSAPGTVIRRALEAYRDHRWQSSLVFYLQAALAGAEIGYFNAGYLCRELKINYGTALNCIEQLLSMSYMIRAIDAKVDPYILLTLADYYQWSKTNLTKSAQLYLDLFRNGDPQGLYNLAQMEEDSELNRTIPSTVWTQMGIRFDERTVTSRYRRLQVIYQHCRTLKTSKSDESYLPCTLAYLRVSAMVLIEEQSAVLITLTLLIVSTIFVIVRRM